MFANDGEMSSELHLTIEVHSGSANRMVAIETLKLCITRAKTLIEFSLNIHEQLTNSLLYPVVSSKFSIPFMRRNAGNSID